MRCYHDHSGHVVTFPKSCFLQLQQNKLKLISVTSPKSQISFSLCSSPRALLVEGGGGGGGCSSYY